MRVKHACVMQDVSDVCVCVCQNVCFNCVCVCVCGAQRARSVCVCVCVDLLKKTTDLFNFTGNSSKLSCVGFQLSLFT